MNTFRPFRTYLFLSATALAGIPAVGPDYQRPEVPQATAWKDATPSDSAIRGAWWESFNDAALNGLETKALQANQSLEAAAARLEEARAAAGVARSAYFPNAAAGGSVSRNRYSDTQPNGFPQDEVTTIQANVDASWELDLFGRIRRLNEGERDEALASQASFEAVRLALTADVATTYFTLRSTEREMKILADGIELRQHELKLVSAKRRDGAAADFDVSRAQTELAGAQAEAVTLKLRRSALEDALAVLVGEPAATFRLPSVDQALGTPAEVPSGIPSDVLERRPDVAAAERSLAAANARIGVAKAAFFPAISLTGSYGAASGQMHTLFDGDSRQWGFGPSLYLPIFQGGRNKANLAAAKATYEENVAQYRQKVLVAFREVQDALTATKLLAEQTEAQDRQLAAARRSNELAQKRYDAGYVAYFEVIDAQRTVLASERASVQLAAQRLNTRVALITALGGGWSAPAGFASL